MISNDRGMHQRKEPHSSPETLGVRCHMCPHLSCIEREKAWVHRWHYYCELLRKRFTFKELYEITEDMCPVHREIKRRYL